MKRRIITIMMMLSLVICLSGCSCLMLAVAVDVMGPGVNETEEWTEHTTEKHTAEQLTTQTGERETETETEVEIDKVTVLIYMNGSDLESEDSQATFDIEEMLRAPYSEDVNIVIQTMGTMEWSDKYDISSDETQRFILKENDLQLVSRGLGQLDCTKSDTLRDFVKWGVKEYPAERYILLFWNHGGGPVYGFGYDEYQGYDENLSLDEIKEALGETGTDFELIGMDCCIMSCLEVCYALYNYCDYMILSEEFEPGDGWEYEGFLTALSDNPEIGIEELGKVIIDDMIEVYENYSEDESATLALIDQSMIKILFSAWKDFAYMHEEELLRGDLVTGIHASDRAFSDWFDDDDDDTMADYYLTDILTFAKSIDSKEALALENVANNTIVYYRGTGSVENLTGLSVTIPYGDIEFYEEMSEVFINCGMDKQYIEWLEKFAYVSGVGGFEFVD